MVRVGDQTILGNLLKPQLCGDAVAYVMGLVVISFPLIQRCTNLPRVRGKKGDQTISVEANCIPCPKSMNICPHLSMSKLQICINSKIY
jgi:hypothetical protein